MFCVFLQNTTPKEYELIKVIHNDEEYHFSRDLSIKHSSILSDLIIKNKESAINLDYSHERDNFQLICNLFNYKRIFITKSNFDYLEFTAKFLQIPILIKKTAKFQNQYNDFLKNPIFKQIKSIRYQIFSLFQPSDIFDENDGEDIENSDETTNESLLKITNNSNIPTIQYEPEYSSTVSHLIFSACLFDPINIDKYIQIIVQDQILITDFIQTVNSNKLSPQITTMILDILNYYLHKTKEIKHTTVSENSAFNFELDTNLGKYLDKLGRFYRSIYQFWKKYPLLTELIKRDDIDELQAKLSSNPQMMNDKSIYTNLFKTSMISSSINCFKYFLINWIPLFETLIIDNEMVQSAIIGGNIEIFRLILEKYQGSPSDFIRDTILFHKKDIFNWIIENNCQFLSLYNSCCSRILYGKELIVQKWYKCKKCHKGNHGCCKFCAKNCHKDNLHDVNYYDLLCQCFCDDECELSKNIELEGNKKFVEIDDLILLSIYCLNTYALKALINEGAYIVRCRDRATKNAYVLDDRKLILLISSLKGYKENSIDEITYEKIMDNHKKKMDKYFPSSPKPNPLDDIFGNQNITRNVQNVQDAMNMIRKIQNDLEEEDLNDDAGNDNDKNNLNGNKCGIA